MRHVAASMVDLTKLSKSAGIQKVTRGMYDGSNLSEAKMTLFNLRKQGNLIKRGFRWFKRWKTRKVLLAGRMLFYCTINGDVTRPRGSLELTHNTVIDETEIDGYFCISIFPKIDCLPSQIWYLYHESTLELESWRNAIEKSIELIARQQKPATLRGMGKIGDHFELHEELGHGRFGTVRRATQTLTNREFAVKIINKNKIRKHALKNELQVLGIIKDRVGVHENICGTYEVYQDEFLIHVVMELLSGDDLFDRIEKGGHLSEATAAQILRQLVIGVRQLHRVGIIHRDLKNENILFDSTGTHPKIADFGSSLCVDLKTQNTKVLVGTPGYIAPEVLSDCIYTSACDVFALGCILYIMLVGYPPFYGNSELELHQKIIRGDFKFFAVDWSGINSSAMQLVSRMLDVNHKSRISTEEILNHSWLRSPLSETPLHPTISRLETYNEQRKLKSAAVREHCLNLNNKNDNSNNNGKIIDNTTSTGGGGASAGGGNTIERAKVFVPADRSLTAPSPIFSKVEIQNIRKNSPMVSVRDLSAASAVSRSLNIHQISFDGF